MLDVALLSSRPNFPFLLLNCTEAVPSQHSGHRGCARAIIYSKEHGAWRGTRAFLNLSADH
jgi:hypothetical protein